MHLPLDPKLERLIAKHMADGSYASPAEVVEAALALMDDADRPFYEHKSEIDRALSEGLSSGSANPFDPEDIKRRGRERHEQGKTD